MQDFRMETFLAVCRHMNYTKAARELNLTQPAVSQHIRYLENEYGVELFVQNGKKLGLTAAGEILKSAAIVMKHDETHMKLRMQQTQKGIEKYSFGATLSVSEFMIVDKLERFIRNHPQSHIRMQVANTKELLRRLDSSEIDFAVVEGEFPKDQYEYLPFAREEYIAVASREKARVYDKVSVEDILKETLLLRESGSGTREILERWLAEQGIRVEHFTNLIELGSIGAINYMLKAGLGITFCYKAAVQKELNCGELTQIDLQGMPIEHEVMFIFRKDSIFREDYLAIYRQLCE